MGRSEAMLKYSRSAHGKAKMKAYAKKPENIEKRKKYLAVWYAQNRERIRERQRKFLASKPSYLRDRAFRFKYGITLADVKALLALQGGICAICERPLDMEAKTSERSKPHVDHNHATGKVRGILCPTCNKAIGLLGDTVDGVERAVTYLRLSDGKF